MIEAVDIDPTFAAAHYLLYSVYEGLGRHDRAKGAMRLAMQHRYKLPEGSQYELRSNYQFVVNEDAEAAIEVTKQWAALYPQSIDAHETLSR